MVERRREMARRGAHEGRWGSAAAAAAQSLAEEPGLSLSDAEWEIFVAGLDEAVTDVLAAGSGVMRLGRRR